MYNYNTCFLIRAILNKYVHAQTITNLETYNDDIFLQIPRTNYGMKNIILEGTKLYNNFT